MAILAALAALVGLLAGRARADGFSASVEPGWSHAETDTTDQAGATSHDQLDALTQRYRLSLERQLTTGLSASVGGSLLDERGWQRVRGRSGSARAQSLTEFARLTLGMPSLTAGLGWDRREQQHLGASASAVVVDSYTANASWRPADLPELELRLSRVEAFDRARSLQDSSTDSAQLGARYRGAAYDVRYLLGWGRAADRLHRVDTTTIDQTVFGSRSDTLVSGRLTTYLSASLQSRNTTISARGPDGKVARPQLPVAGLSAVVTLPATSTQITLAPNPALVDGTTSAGAGLNVGYGPSTLGDRSPREAGARFADEVTGVNTLYVWLDRSPVPVASALTGSVQVFQSRDNRSWTEITGLVATASAFENRVEVSLPAEVRARHLKVTLLPIATGLTTDPAYRDLLVTELQLLLVQPVAAVLRHARSVTTQATALTHAVLLRAPELAHDLSASVSRHSDPALTTYGVVNGLAGGHRLRERLSLTARVARQDSDVGQGHEGSWDWNAGLAGRPIPAAQWSVTYSGSQSERNGLTHAVGGLGRADFYEGIGAQASAVVSSRKLGPVTTRTLDVNGAASLTPNRVVSLTTGAQYSKSWRIAPDAGVLWSQFLRVDGGLSLTPAPALSGAATVSRVLIGERPTTLATVQLNFSPLRGELQLSTSYSRTLDTEAQATTEVLVPSLRWAIRSQVTLTTSYTWLRSDSPVQVLASRVISANLLVSL